MDAIILRILRDRSVNLSIDRGPLRFGHALQQRAKRSGNRLGIFPNFIGSSQPSPRDFSNGSFRVAESGFGQRRCQTGRIGETEGILCFGWQSCAPGMLQDQTPCALPIWLFERSPGRETRSCAWPQHALQLAQGGLHVSEKHHAETAGGEIETFIGKWKRMRVGLVKTHIA